MKMMGTVVCLLALISVGGGPSASGPSPEKRPPSPHLTKALGQATGLHYKGDYAKALALFLEGYRAALSQNEAGFAARFLWGMGNCHFAQRHYREALQEFVSARDAFEHQGDLDSASALNGSLSSLYWQLGEFDAAIASARLALAHERSSDTRGHRARLLILLAGLLAQDGKLDESRRLFDDGIREAARFDDPELLSNGWDRLGSEMLSRNQPREAEDALLEAFRIRKLNRLPSLASSYRKLGILRLEQGDVRSASALLDASVAESKSQGTRTPEWRFYHARGRLRLSEGKVDEAHANFSMALELARDYRLMTPGADSTRVSVESRLQTIYASFIETGVQLYFRDRRRDLARETFEALEENRAGSLAQRLRERKEFRRNMPHAYWETLAKLQLAERAALVEGGDAPRQSIRRLRASIIEMESNAGGAGFSERPNLLARLQAALDGETVLLSFQLGDRSSQLWAATASNLTLYRLPGGREISDAVSRFRDAVLRRDSSSEALGRALYRKLFGGLGSRYENKSRWLLSLDEGLFELPFAALVTARSRQVPVYLIERHSLQIVSGAANWLDGAKSRRMDGPFLGIGDPVYNTADGRWQDAHKQNTSWLQSKLAWPWRVNAGAPEPLGLSRLPGSGREVEACASEWRRGSYLLRGIDATRENLRQYLEKRPSVAHFATHVVQDPRGSMNALLALGVSATGRDELLGSSEIGSWNVDAGVVVLSGCSSGVARAPPGPGLLGMTRAWLMAGAGAVIATKWPVPDDVGVFFRHFYRELQRSGSYDPAGALRAAQIETLRSGDWRSHPGFWAAYFAMGNY